MKVVRTVKALRSFWEMARKSGRSVGFVPTMGFFHEGHLSLMRKSRQQNDVTIISSFVNPSQFGPKEDLRTYPRDPRRDVQLARKEGVDLLFIPSVEEMYPEGFASSVEVKGVSEGLCGGLRPGHFVGVATVVLKLLNIVRPDVMYLGQKDAQQVAVIRRMVKDLNVPVRIHVCSIVRERDGLAMSSRNFRLSSEERRQALVISRALREAKQMVARGENNAKQIILRIKKLLVEETSASIEYISCVSATDMKSIRKITKEALIAVAVKFPSARLIDNVVVKIRSNKG